MKFNNLAKLGFGGPSDDEPPKRLLATAFTKFNTDVLRTGGIPYGRVIQIWGEEHSGKTLLAMHLVAMAQRDNPSKAAVYVDTEMTFDKAWAKLNGIDLERLYLVQSNDVDSTFGSVLKAIESGEVCIVVLDSIGAVNESNAKAGEAFDTKVTKGVVEEKHKTIPGLFAKHMTKFVKFLVPAIKSHDVLFVAVNQIRDKIGVLYGPTEDYPGGRAWKHSISLSMRTRKIRDIKDNPEQPAYGVTVAINVVKNKQAPLGKTDDDSHLNFYFTADGIEKAQYASLYNDAITHGVLVGKGAWIYLVNSKKEQVKSWNGKSRCQEALAQDESLRNQVAEFLKEVMNGQSTDEVPEGILDESEGD